MILKFINKLAPEDLKFPLMVVTGQRLWATKKHINTFFWAKEFHLFLAAQIFVCAYFNRFNLPDAVPFGVRLTMWTIGIGTFVVTMRILIEAFIFFYHRVGRGVLFIPIASILCQTGATVMFVYLMTAFKVDFPTDAILNLYEIVISFVSICIMEFLAVTILFPRVLIRPEFADLFDATMQPYGQSWKLKAAADDITVAENQMLFVGKHNFPVTTVLLVCSDDHYCRIFTKTGEFYLRANFTDVVNQLGTKMGMCVHRQFWVAKQAIQRVVHVDNRMVLLTTVGQTVPVSRGNQRAAEDMFK